jgi:DNA-binding MarR family transcriptional regulator
METESLYGARQVTRSGMVNADSQAPDTDQVAILITLLKVATRIGAPMRDAVADREGLSVTELRILLALGGEGALAGHELADLMAMQPMNISRALMVLTDMALVEQVSDPVNRRRKPHRLTPQGEAKFLVLLADMRDVANFVFGPLSNREQAQAARLLTKIDVQLRHWAPATQASHIRRS